MKLLKMNRKFVLFISLGAFFGGWASGMAAPLPKELSELETAYSKHKTIEAKFTQTTETKLTGTEKKTSGVLTLQAPGRFRWETLVPDKNLLVSNGKKFWFYTPPFSQGDKGQVIVRKTAEIQSELATTLLSGSFSKLKKVSIEKKSKFDFILKPEKGTAGSVTQIQLHLSFSGDKIERVILQHDNGNTADVSLSEIQFETPVPEGFFDFVTPPMTDVIVN